MILNSNTRDGLQALRQMNGLCPAQTLRVGTEHIGRAGERQRHLGRRFKGGFRIHVRLFFRSKL